MDTHTQGALIFVFCIMSVCSAFFKWMSDEASSYHGETDFKEIVAWFLFWWILLPCLGFIGLMKILRPR